MIQKWNPEKRVYQPYQPPAGYITLYETDMEKPVNCARCGRQITFGEGYSSMQIHNAMGMGYSVCVYCYNAELEEELKYRHCHECRRKVE